MNTQVAIIALFVVATALAAPSLRSHHDSSTQRIGMYGGKNTTIDKHHYLASLVIFGSEFCAATIVSDSWVVAPFICVNGLGPENVNVVVGSNDGLTGTSYTAKQLVNHPKYSVQVNYLDYNYVCIQIDGKFKWSAKVKPASLPSKKVAPNTKLQVAGYGERTPTVLTSYIQAGLMTSLTNDDCKDAVAQVFPTVPMTNRMMCAWNQNKTTLCMGDWGVALVNNGVFYGQYMAGADEGFCSKEAKPGVFAEIHSVASWIKKTTGAKYEHEL